MVQLSLYSDVLCKKGGRKENQDFTDTRENPFISQFVVADGLGGQGGGALASKIATKKVLINLEQSKPDSVEWDQYFASQWLTETFEKAHSHVKKLQLGEKPEFSHMATTMVVLMIMDGKAIWGHVGDSRLYLFRNGQIHHQTKDHSVPQMLVSSGEIEPDEMRHHPDRNRLLRALGDKREQIQARIQIEEHLQPGDVFLLCSDGFWEYVTENEMLDSLYKANNPEDWLKRMEQAYLLPHVEEERIEEDKEESENDNYTALAVWYGETPSTNNVIEETNQNEKQAESSLLTRIVKQTKEVRDDFNTFLNKMFKPDEEETHHQKLDTQHDNLPEQDAEIKETPGFKDLTPDSRIKGDMRIKSYHKNDKGKNK